MDFNGDSRNCPVGPSKVILQQIDDNFRKRCFRSICQPWKQPNADVNHSVAASVADKCLIGKIEASLAGFETHADGLDHECVEGERKRPSIEC
ncbi:hypothetical protein [Streptomyces zhihengii]|uniref:Uncharacterized protein n=1 Tax=Streptomyces zhihengii TaxID=1818004 RepID=A0ABS2V582_9ACTN|nr:hypothetical protein [Streptomyces zhihengii]MBM9624483.1 hypothetical protein [Streptomyces zhihengii]